MQVRFAHTYLVSSDFGIGTGSILEAFRVNAPLILIPNTTLLDNHQVELAEELSRQKYAIVGSTRSVLPAPTN